MEAGLVRGWCLCGGDTVLIRCLHRGDAVCHDKYLNSRSVYQANDGCFAAGWQYNQDLAVRKVEKSMCARIVLKDHT